jgi:hypothetical protein
MIGRAERINNNNSGRKLKYGSRAPKVLNQRLVALLENLCCDLVHRLLVVVGLKLVRPLRASASTETYPQSSVARSGNNPGIQREASAAGKASNSGSRGPFDVSTPRFKSSEMIRRA